MTIKQVSETLCKERSGNILEKITAIDAKLEKWMNNHASHMQSDIKEINERITKIESIIAILSNKIQDKELLENEEKKRNDSKNEWSKLLISVGTGAVFSILNLLFKYMGWI